MSGFKVGDKVRCTDHRWNDGIHGRFRAGDEYTVVAVDSKGWVTVDRSPGGDYPCDGWDASRFELVSPEPPSAPWEPAEAPEPTVMIELPEAVVAYYASRKWDRGNVGSVVAACRAALGESQ